MLSWAKTPAQIMLARLIRRDSETLGRRRDAGSCMTGSLRRTTFANVHLGDPFFDSLKAQYKEFSDWFKKKATENVYVIDGPKGAIRGFLYLKREDDPIDDVTPPLPALPRLKVGTLKVEAKGTKIGERILKRIFDEAIDAEVEEIYVTVFDTHDRLIKLFERYGFKARGSKQTPNGTELVLVRSLTDHAGDSIKEFPLVRTKNARKYLLAIHPPWHTELFADSILKTEDPAIVKDVAHSNTIHKVYVSGLTLTRMAPGDMVIIYRTTDILGRAKYRSVATSLCVVEEVKRRSDFADADAFVAFAEPHSVFPEQELRDRFASGQKLYAVRMTYNAAFKKRIIRSTLLSGVGISEHPRWDLRELTNPQFQKILKLGGVNEALVID